ncbi:MAG TPA: aldehyde dehydrogenase family protein, partial [Acidimicrobiia bacterium]|nr:aldehyde dehydrogenase family protein [Acidimicrobiia bacterium]
RRVGGPALRRLTFHERAAMLKAIGGYVLEHKEELYALSSATGATRADSWLDIEGGTGVLATYSSKGRKELPNARFVIDGDPEAFSKDGSFAAIHLRVPREGVAVLVNAFNFPVWGMLEKLAPAILAGVPVLVKPATPTAYLAEAAFRLMIDAGVLPDGAAQLVCGSLGDAFDHLTGQDSGVTGRFLPGATPRESDEHPFRKHFDDLEVGDTLTTGSRTITIEDIERFADLTGDHFYAHMDEEAAAKSPIFGGRVAHGYFVISAAAGLFVWPDPGPVLANYGIDRLRFTTPVKPGDEIHVVFTCKEKTPRDGAGYGEVRWDTQVVNGDGKVVAAYDVLTMVATRA